MKYVALLRGVNVGGNSIIKMADLKDAVEKSGFTKLISRPVYKDITMRNYTTAQKLLALIEQSK
jgi:uncharacterized protein (DUF1697 family)